MNKTELRKAQGNRSLLDIALNVHGTKTGSYERSFVEQFKDVSLLEKAIELWEPSNSKFDQLVYEIINEALNEKACYEPK